MRASAHETDAYMQHPDEELDVQWEEVLESKDTAGRSQGGRGGGSQRRLHRRGDLS